MLQDRRRLFYSKTAARIALAASVAMSSSATTTTELLTRQLESVPEALPQVERDGPWLQVCEERPEGRQCSYEQTAQASNGDQVILTLLPPSPQDRPPRPVAVFRTPLYALLPPGMTLTFDNRTSGRIEFRACSPRGCLASVVLEGPVRSKMASANRVAVQFISQAMEPVTADFSLSGSAAILKSM